MNKWETKIFIGLSIILFATAIFFVIYAAVNMQVLKSPAEPTTMPQEIAARFAALKYDLFRDLLLFFLSLLAAIGVGVFVLVRHFVLENVKAELEEVKHNIIGAEWQI